MLTELADYKVVCKYKTLHLYLAAKVISTHHVISEWCSHSPVRRYIYDIVVLCLVEVFLSEASLFRRKWNICHQQTDPQQTNMALFTQKVLL